MSANSNSKSQTLQQFLNERIIKKDSNLELTHIEYGGEFSNKKFHIKNEDYLEYKRLYYKDVLKIDRTHNILERQLIHKTDNCGPMLIDIDLRHESSLQTRQYNMTDVDNLVQLYLDIILKTFEIEEDTQFQVIVQEKQDARITTKKDSTYLKDGIHLIFTIGLTSIHQLFIRKKIIEKIQKIWNHIKIENTWDDVFDKCISNGTNSWLAPNSKKKDETMHYKITKVFNITYDNENDKWNSFAILTEPKQLSNYLSQNYKSLFIRDTPACCIHLEKDCVLDEIQAFRNKNIKPNTEQVASKNTSFGTIIGGDESYQLPISAVRQIKNREQLEGCITAFTENLPSHKHHLLEAYLYAMTLPESYYGIGSYDKWIKVGFALKNTDIYLLIAWVYFSAQSPTFDFINGVDEICDHWTKFQQHEIGGVRKESLMYWSRNEDQTKYQEVREQSTDYYIEKSVESLTLDQLNGKGKNRGCCDYDIAYVVYWLKKGYYVSTNIKTNSWFMFNGTYWTKDDCGTSLRSTLSTDVRNLYWTKALDMRNKANQIKTSEGEIDIECEKYKLLYAKSDILLNISIKLANTHDKDNVMRECRELFYDRDFEKNLDQDRYLLCCTNGIVDFRNKVFRKGTPEDYVSKCTKIKLREVDETVDADIISQINDYMNKLFPIPELCEYAWTHLASVIVGDTSKTQCLHYYTGVGQNGKSMLVKLMQMILGDYATDLDINFFVNDRPGRGKATPELERLIGARLAITAEPSEGERLNEGPMKQITSGVDSISYRGLFKEQDSFIPQCHSIIMANHFLPITANDHGTWRRIRVLIFLSLFTNNPVQNDPDKPYQFKKEDNFEEKFKIWAPVFLAMLVKISYVNQGSCETCPIVTAESEKYRQREDIIAAFIDENVEIAEDQRIRKTQLNKKFRDWYKDTQGISKIPSNKTQELNNSMEKFCKGPAKANGWQNVKFKQDYNKPPEIINENTDSEENSSIMTE